MRRGLLAQILLTAIVMLPPSHGWAGGDICRAISMIGVKDYQVLVKNSNGRVTLVNFWATWCTPCIRELPALARLREKFGNSGLNVILISANEPEERPEVFSLLRKKGITFTTYMKKSTDDATFMAAVDPAWSGALPATWIYGPGGKRLRVISGERTYEEWEEIVKSFLSER